MEAQSRNYDDMKCGDQDFMRKKTEGASSGHGLRQRMGKKIKGAKSKIIRNEVYLSGGTAKDQTLRSGRERSRRGAGQLCVVIGNN